jgi:PAS domain S-box-containing protein
VGSSNAWLVEALQAAGEVGRDLLAVDWAATPVGALDAWPRTLTTAVRILLTSRFSMWMAWGPELTFFCNEAYRRGTLGKKYPWALGRPAREVWAEIWPDIGPRIERVLQTGEATWDESLLLFLERSGYVEETYHTFSYSPLSDDVGAIAGMLCVVSEDTDRVVGERRMATLRDLGSEPTIGRDDRDYLRGASRHLGANDRSLPFTLTYLFDGEGTAELVAWTGIAPGHAAAPITISTVAEEPVWPLARLADAGEVVLIDGLDLRFDDLPTGAWQKPPDTAVLLPLLQPVRAERPYGFLVVGANPHRRMDQSYRSFLALMAAQLASGIASARAYESERRRAEELAELDRAKTAFFTNVSHELRTPLTLLLGPAEDALAQRDSLPAAERQRMEMIARNAARLLKLVNALLDFSRLEAGSGVAVFEPVELAGYTAELASMFESAITNAGLALEIDCPSLEQRVYVDPEMWAKIVMNLLSNALKYTFSGKITVRVHTHQGRARLVVSDTGIGIEPSQQSRLFERFHRAPDARGRTFEGSGIGLAMVAELASLHGGHAAVESSPEAGSTFTVELPLGSAHLPPEQLATEPREVSIEREAAGFLAEADRWQAPPGRLPTDARPQSGVAEARDMPRVLVVDDNADMRDYVASILAESCSVQTARDGEEALAMIGDDPPDLVLTDVMMPRLDGFGLLAALHDDPVALAVPVVMVSARAGDDGVIDGLEAGANDYLIKPFSARELLARVHANLELDRARRVRDELERSQRMQDQAERLAEVGSWEIDLRTNVLRGSEQLRRMLGISTAEFAVLRYGDVLAGVIHPDDRQAATDTVERALATRAPFDYEARLLHQDGDARWVRVRGAVKSDEHGNPVKLQGYMQDITERRQAEQALAAAAAAREVAAREHQIADGLQRRMLPAETFQSVHLEVGAYYRSGEEGMRAGGDWYDAVDLGAGRTALMIGDVTGRGIPAASLMGQLRAAVHAYARLDLPPAELLELLDQLVTELGEGRLVTCIYGVHDPVGEEFVYANAGHLPPLLARPGQQAQRLPDAAAPPLGMGASQYPEQRVELPAGTVVVLYTDGLVERRDLDLDAQIDLLATKIDLGNSAPAALASALAHSFAPQASEDDIAILAARSNERVRQRTATLDVPPDPRAIHDARGFATSTLTQWALPSDIVADAVLIASELVTNAIVYGRPPIQLRLRATNHELAIEVDDRASAMPRKLRAGPEDVRGRGLGIVANLASRWAARPDGRGKTVWSTLAIPDPPTRPIG